MNEPKRWSEDEAGATFDECRLLNAGRSARLPDGLRRRVWAGVASGAVGLGATSTAVGAAGAAQSFTSTLGSSVLAKGIAAVAIAGTLGTGAVMLRERSSKAPSAIITGDGPRLSSHRAEPSGLSRGEIEARDPAPPDEALANPASSSTPRVIGPHGVGNGRRAAHHAPAASAPVTPAPDTAPPREEVPSVASRLREESAALLAVRKSLLSGEAAEAVRMLQRAERAYPKGALVEEREALFVRALMATGQRDLAEKRADAFARQFPRSPHASEVRSLVSR